ncbi:MAG: 2-oxoacid:acceptor oxidoreductase family protein, partial [Planctomycetaceae bacterium]|nr:2-oxoacid:acceptor oxidoreductase family protein [Planctomycetaceae bacterium]
TRNVLAVAEPGATFLLNAPYGPEEVWSHLPVEVQQQIIDKQLKFYVVDAYRLAGELGLGQRINTVMQTCFFALADILPRDEAIGHIKQAIEKTYGKRGETVVRKNCEAVDSAVAALHQVEVPATATSTTHRTPPVPDNSPDFVKRVTGMMLAGLGDLLPVSALPVDGT